MLDIFKTCSIDVNFIHGILAAKAAHLFVTRGASVNLHIMIYLFNTSKCHIFKNEEQSDTQNYVRGPCPPM